jgi:hypothetical protein
VWEGGEAWAEAGWCTVVNATALLISSKTNEEQAVWCLKLVWMPEPTELQWCALSCIAPPARRCNCTSNKSRGNTAADREQQGSRSSSRSTKGQGTGDDTEAGGSAVYRSSHALHGNDQP